MSDFRIISVDQLIEELEQYSHNELHVHHTWRPRHSDFDGSNHVQLQESMRNYHVNTLGWSAIGQHISIAPDGKIITGRDFDRNPASIKGYNRGAFAVEMIGNFDVGHDVLEGKQKDAILRLAKFFNDKGKYIRFHRENSSKTCPGSSIDKDSFMEEVNRLSDKEQTVSKWAEDAQAWVKDNKISDGTDPKGTVTREQLWTMLYRLNN